MSVVTVVEVEAAGMAVTSIAGHRATQDHLLDVGITMMTIADLRAELIHMSQAKTETATDHRHDVDLLHQAAHSLRRRDGNAAIRLQKLLEVHRDGEGVIAVATAGLVHANAKPTVKTAGTEMMRSDADRLRLFVDVAHHHLGATAADHRPHEVARRLQNVAAKLLLHLTDHLHPSPKVQPPRQSPNHLARKAEPSLQTI